MTAPVLAAEVRARAAAELPGFLREIEELVGREQADGDAFNHLHDGRWLSTDAWRTIPFGQRVADRLDREIEAGDTSLRIWSRWIRVARELGFSGRGLDALTHQSLFQLYRTTLRGDHPEFPPRHALCNPREP